jgi:hypothetical protein
MKQLILFPLLLIGFIACQKVIDVDLNDAAQKVVIVASYSAHDSTVRTKITLTSSYFDSDPEPEVNDAMVTMYDYLGNATNVPFTANGEYILSNYIPITNSTYTLTVNYNNSIYTATCDLNPLVPLEPITYDSIPPGIFTESGGYIAYLNFYDPISVVNHYEIVLSRNGKIKDKLNQIFTQDDNLTDGNFVERPLFGRFFHLNDTVGMELRTIDEQVYNYLNQAVETVLNQNSAAPGNPEPFWDNGALGYFSAYSSSFQEVIIL